MDVLCRFRSGEMEHERKHRVDIGFQSQVQHLKRMVLERDSDSLPCRILQCGRKESADVISCSALKAFNLVLLAQAKDGRRKSRLCVPLQLEAISKVSLQVTCAIALSECSLHIV